MKKILALALLAGVPSFIHTMETTGGERKNIQSSGHAPKFVTSAVTPDRTKIVGVSSTGNVSLWDVKSGQVIDRSVTSEVKGVQQYIKAVGFNKDGTVILVTSLEGTEQYGIIDPEILTIIKSHPLIEKRNKAALKGKNISPDRTKIAILDETGNISLWDARSGQLLNSSIVKGLDVKDNNFLPKLSFSPDGKVLNVTTYQVSFKDVYPSVQKYDVSSMLVPQKSELIGLKGSQLPTFVKSAISPDGTKIAGVSSTGNLSVWDIESKQAIDSSVVNGLMNVAAVEFNKEGTKVFVTTSEGIEDYDIIDPLVLTVIRSNPLLQKTTGVGKTIIKSKIVSPDRTKIVLLEEDGNMSLWDVQSGELIRRSVGKKPSAKSIKFSPDGQSILTFD